MSTGLVDKIINHLGTHAIVTQGTSNGWYIRKYNNGRMEAWKNVTLSNVAITSQVGQLYQTGSTLSESLPSSHPFATVNQCQLTCKESAYAVWPALFTVTTSTVQYRLLSAASRASVSTHVLHLYVEGTWSG